MVYKSERETRQINLKGMWVLFREQKQCGCPWNASVGSEGLEGREGTLLTLLLPTHSANEDRVSSVFRFRTKGSCGYIFFFLVFTVREHLNKSQRTYSHREDCTDLLGRRVCMEERWFPTQASLCAPRDSTPQSCSAMAARLLGFTPKWQAVLELMNYVD